MRSIFRVRDRLQHTPTLEFAPHAAPSAAANSNNMARKARRARIRVPPHKGEADFEPASAWVTHFQYCD
jgi:hypothetical protein